MRHDHHNRKSVDGMMRSAGGLLVLGVLVGAALLGGYNLGVLQAGRVDGGYSLDEAFAVLAEERRQLQAMRERVTADLDALALRVGSLRAHLLRLNALGERLVNMGKLDAEEFDFSAEPARGGVDQEADGRIRVDDLAAELELLSRALKDREHKLNLLEDLLTGRELQDEVTLSGKPVKQGWISSGFGRRTDPFTGKKKYHRGIDFAGKPGSEVLAVAAGVVTEAERQSGYGYVVEIRHANDYVTRYAHNRENLVKVGDRVEKGETIAVLGSSGRSSGPHVHFEVHHNGKIVNPTRFIKKG